MYGTTSKSSPPIRHGALAQQPEAKVAGKSRPLTDQILIKVRGIKNLETVGLKLGLSGDKVDRALVEGPGSRSGLEFHLLDVAKRHVRLTTANLVYALQESGNKDCVDKIPELKGVQGEPVLDVERPVCLTDEKLSHVDVEPTSSVVLQREFCHVPLNHIAYCIGKLLGLNRDQLVQIEQTDRILSKSLTLLKILQNFGYESGHLYGALKVIGDKAALKAFPVHLSGVPKKPLCKLSPEAQCGQIQFVCASLMKDAPRELGEALGLKQEHITRAMDNHRNAPQRQALAMLNYVFQWCYFSSQDEAVKNILAVVRRQCGDQLKIKLTDAFYWLNRSQMQDTVSDKEQLCKAEMDCQALLK